MNDAAAIKSAIRQWVREDIAHYLSCDDDVMSQDDLERWAQGRPTEDIECAIMEGGGDPDDTMLRDFAACEWISQVEARRGTINPQEHLMNATVEALSLRFAHIEPPERDEEYILRDPPSPRRYRELEHARAWRAAVDDAAAYLVAGGRAPETDDEYVGWGNVSVCYARSGWMGARVEAKRRLTDGAPPAPEAP